MQQNNNPDVGLTSVITNTKVDTNKITNINRATIQNNPKILNTIIKDFYSSVDYKEMCDVDKYYKSQNIQISNRSKKMMLYEEVEKVINGETVKEECPYLADDLSKANHKIAHGYLYELINQCKDYLVGNPVKTEYDKKITKKVKDLIDDILYKDNDWGKFNQENVKNAQKYKIGWSRVIVDDNGKLRLLNINSKQVIYFLDDYDELTCLIYLYSKYEYDKNGKKKEIKYAEVFDETYKDTYISEKGFNYKMYEPNSPLITKVTKYTTNEVISTETANGTSIIEEIPVDVETNEVLSWNKIPWVMWKYNEDDIDALTPIRCFIDILDINLSDLANNVDDIQDAIWILENYQGQSISQFMHDLKVKKAINVGEGGKVDNKTVEIPTEAREKLYDKAEKNIYRFGRGINFADRDNLGNASGVALKWSYGPLDEKCDDLEENGQAALNDLFNLIFTYLNISGISINNYDSNDIKFIFDRSMIINEKEVVQMVNDSIDVISQKTALSHHPFVEDAEEEIKQIESDYNELDEEVDKDEDIDGTEEDEQNSEEDKRPKGNNNPKKDSKDL